MIQANKVLGFEDVDKKINKKLQRLKTRYLVLMVQWLLLLLIQKSQRLKILDITSLSTKATLNPKIREIENKISNAASFIYITGFNRLTKIDFDARIKAATKNLVSESQLDTALDIADKSREEIYKVQIMYHEIKLFSTVQIF